ncbi:DNA-binding transcriptional regulator, XRE family [Seinonella peptonophila]|uniref:DNA-binding transcriptional regulator, XRE family n=1 Tax=Seinonella peptonophila TaxID=112248 RepID=A0A1M4ZZ96_9BACL|nr:helix-turn-helix transcriptional regulator [Seinonella peptonophila]SHF23177.1 DNA-binding transcriptional regulator, XRE family [Seinonella peptonophila]
MIRFKLSQKMGEHKLTQKDVSKGTGIRPDTISEYYYETSKSPFLRHMNEFCKFFKCQPGDLLEYEEKMIRFKLSQKMGEHKLTQKDVSKGTGIRPDTISEYYYETSKSPFLRHMCKFCKFFKCLPGDLLEYIDDIDDTDKEPK